MQKNLTVCLLLFFFKLLWSCWMKHHKIKVHSEDPWHAVSSIKHNLIPSNRKNSLGRQVEERNSTVTSRFETQTWRKSRHSPTPNRGDSTRKGAKYRHTATLYSHQHAIFCASFTILWRPLWVWPRLTAGWPRVQPWNLAPLSGQTRRKAF